MLTSIEAKDIQSALGGRSNAFQIWSIASICILGRTMGTNPSSNRFETHVGQNTPAAAFVERYSLWAPRQAKTKSGILRDLINKRFSPIGQAIV
jgi:hypothetical protein